MPTVWSSILIPFFSTYGVSFGPLEVGYKATRVFVSGWLEYFGGQGMYWILFNLGKVNQWFQYNNLNVFWGFFFCYVDPASKQSANLYDIYLLLCVQC